MAAEAYLLLFYLFYMCFHEYHCGGNELDVSKLCHLYWDSHVVFQSSFLPSTCQSSKLIAKAYMCIAATTKRSTTNPSSPGVKRNKVSDWRRTSSSTCTLAPHPAEMLASSLLMRLEWKVSGWVMKSFHTLAFINLYSSFHTRNVTHSALELKG